MPVMEDRKIHPSAQRLYDAAKALMEVEGPSNVARLLGESPQNLTNWENRGVSSKGALKAEALIGCSAMWLATGQGPMTDAAIPEAMVEVADKIRALPPKLQEWTMKEIARVLDGAQAALDAAKQNGLRQSPEAPEDDYSKGMKIG